MLLVLVLAYVVSAQFVMLPPHCGYGKANYSGTWNMDDGEMQVNARLSWDSTVGEATRLVITLFPGLAPPGTNPFVGWWFRYLSQNPVLVSIFQETGDDTTGRPDNCREMLVSGANFSCPAWQMLSNTSSTQTWRRACSVTDQSGGQFVSEIDTSVPLGIPIGIRSSIVGSDFSVAVHLSVTTTSSTKPPAETWIPPANCQPDAM